MCLALVGLPAMAQDDEEATFRATYVTGTTTSLMDIASAIPAMEEARVSLYGEAQIREVEWSDPRLPASMRLTQNLDYYDIDRDELIGAIPLLQSVLLEDHDGAWTGTVYGLLEERMDGRVPQTVLLILDGEGAYEGLSAMLRTTGEPPAQGEAADWEGYIFEGEMTPIPEPPERLEPSAD
jgi:hypothetical protein